MATNLPEGVTEDDLVDGPKVVPLPSGKATFLPEAEMANARTTFAPPKTAIPPSPQPSPIVAVKSEYPELVMLALDVLSARLLGLIALTAACVIWGGVVWNPEQWRIVAAGVFSVTVFLPIMAIYWRSGMKGEK